jgi:hypothetical protein
MERHNRSYVAQTGHRRTYLEDLHKDLLDAYGDTALRIPEKASYYEAAFSYWMEYGPAYGVLDAVEGYSGIYWRPGSPSARS